MHGERLLSRDDVTQTVGLAWPIVGALLLSLSMLFVDNLCVARLGPRYLGAMAVAISLFSMMQVICLGLLSPLSALISHEIGAGQKHVVGRTTQRGLQLAMILAVVLISACFISNRLLLALGQTETLALLSQRFLISISWGVPALLGYFTLRQLTEGASDTRPSIIIAAAAAVINGVLDYGLIYGHLGMPRLGLVGCGIATATSNWLMFASLLAYVLLSPGYRRYSLEHAAPDDGHSLMEIVRTGVPFGASLLTEVAFFATITLVMGTIGVHELASHQIALNAASFLFMVPLGISNAVSIRIGSARGARNPAGVRRAAASGVALTVGFQLFAAFCFLCFPRQIARLYTADDSVIPMAVHLLRIGGLFQLFDGVQVVSMGMLRGVLDTRLPFAITMLSYWLIGCPCALALAFHFKLGPPGLWYGLVAGLCSASVLLQFRFWYVARSL